MLYAIGSSPLGPLKVGVSIDPARRLSQLQTGSPEKLHIYATGTGSFCCAGSEVPVPDLEAELFIHKRLQQQRLSGEWFDIDLEGLITFVGSGEAMRRGKALGDFCVAWDSDAEAVAWCRVAIPL